MIAWVEETGKRTSVAARIHSAAPASAANTKIDPGVLCKSFCGVKTEKSLPEMRIAATLPAPVKKPPQTSGLRPMRLPEGPGTSSETTLFPASLAPFAKAKANSPMSPSSSIDNIK